MPIKIRTKVEGLQALGEAMRGLSSDMQRKTARSSTNAGAQVVRKAAKANIERSPSIETGSLRDAVIVKRVKSQLTSEHIVTVRGRGKPYNKKGQKIARAPHAHFVELGTVNMPAEPFLRPALAEHTQEAVEAMARRLRERIQKAGKG